MYHRFGLVLAILIGSTGAVWADTLCVASSLATLRKGPSTREEVTWRASRFMPLIREDRTGDWFKVRDMDGVIHYVYHTHVTRKIRCVAVSARVARLKSPPSPRQPAQLAYIFAEKYVAFRLIEEVGGNYLVEDDQKNRFLLSKLDAWRPIKRVKMSF
jgi:hypothetical protein